jgi:hypothetical protein
MSGRVQASRACLRWRLLLLLCMAKKGWERERSLSLIRGVGVVLEVPRFRGFEEDEPKTSR